MKILITENQLNKILLEYVVAPFVDASSPYDGNYRYTYTFQLNGLDYKVLLKRRSGEKSYEVVFDYEGGKENVGADKDLEHFNSVLYTVMEIVEHAVKKYKIKFIEFQGVWGLGETPWKNNKHSEDTLRSRAYRRFLRNRYPASSIIEGKEHFTYVDMTVVFPELFNTGEQTRVEKLFDLIEKATEISFTNMQKKNYLGNEYKSDMDFTIQINDLEIDEDYTIKELIIHIEDENEDVNPSYYVSIDFGNQSADEDFRTFDQLYSALAKVLGYTPPPPKKPMRLGGFG
jgi:hypothetical protein